MKPSQFRAGEASVHGPWLPHEAAAPQRWKLRYRLRPVTRASEIPGLNTRWSVLGAALAGAAYGAIAGARLGALPLPAEAAATLLGGVVAATPFAIVALWKRRAAAGGTATQSLLHGFAGACALLLGAESLVYGAIRFVARSADLVDATPGAILAGMVAGIVLAFGVSRGGDWLVRRAGATTIAPGRLALSSTAAITIVALLGSAAPPSPADLTAKGLPQPERTAPRLVIVGVDGMGANVFARYKSSMPVLAHFREQSANGEIVGPPPWLSAAIWTSIATGLPASKHGVTNFELTLQDPTQGTIPIDRLYADPVPGLLLIPAIVGWKLGSASFMPPSSLHRRGVPFWREEAAGRVGIVCWPATWPAEVVSGAIVSDRWPPEKSDVLYHNRGDLPNKVYPPELLDALKGMLHHAGETPDPALVHLAPLKPEEEAEFLWGVGAEPDRLPKAEPFSNPYYGWLNDRSCLAAARHIEEAFHPNVLAVYLLGDDLTAHVVMPDESGRMPGFDEADSRRLSPFFPNYLAALDGELAWILNLGDASTTTVVLSDHGMAFSNNSLFGNWHVGNGLLMARGPGFKAGEILPSGPPETVRPFLMKILTTGTHGGPVSTSH